MVRRALVAFFVCMASIGLCGLAAADEAMPAGKTVIMLAQTTTSSTSLTQAQLDLIAKVRSKAAELIKLAGAPLPSGLTVIQASAFASYNTWLRTKSSQLYTLANKWVSNPPTARTNQTTILGSTQTTTVDPLTIMNMEFLSTSRQIVYESSQMVLKTPALKPRHDALLLIFPGTAATTTSTISNIMNQSHETQMQTIQNISK